jgi:hypothetical protein
MSSSKENTSKNEETTDRSPDAGEQSQMQIGEGINAIPCFLNGVDVTNEVFDVLYPNGWYPATGSVGRIYPGRTADIADDNAVVGVVPGMLHIADDGDNVQETGLTDSDVQEETTDRSPDASEQLPRVDPDGQICSAKGAKKG